MSRKTTCYLLVSLKLQELSLGFEGQHETARSSSDVLLTTQAANQLFVITTKAMSHIVFILREIVLVVNVTQLCQF